MIKLRLDATEEEAALIKRAARKQGLSVSGFVRGVFSRNHQTTQKTSQPAAPMLRHKSQAKDSPGQHAP